MNFIQFGETVAVALTLFYMIKIIWSIYTWVSFEVYLGACKWTEGLHSSSVSAVSSLI